MPHLTRRNIVRTAPTSEFWFDHDERIRCAHAARVVENYLDNVAYGKKVETYIRGLVEAASIDGAISESNTEV